MTSSGNFPLHCDHEACKIGPPHCHIWDHESCGIDHPHYHICEHEAGENESDHDTRPGMLSSRNDTQVGSINYQAKLLQQLRSEEERAELPQEEEEISPKLIYHSAEWQPSYAVGGGTDLTRTLRPTSHRTFSWGGPGSNAIIPSPDHSGASSAPESRAEEHLKRPTLAPHESSTMGELLRRRLESTKPMDTSGIERGTGTPHSQLSSPTLRSPRFGTQSMGSPGIGPSPIRSSPVRTPDGENESDKEQGRPKRPKLVQEFRKSTKSTIKGLSKGKEKAK